MSLSVIPGVMNRNVWLRTFTLAIVCSIRGIWHETHSLPGVPAPFLLLLLRGAGAPSPASLLPEIHLAILRREDILPNLESLLAGKEAEKLQAVLNAPSLALVSGPSRTADIEMTLTIGVHGPRLVHVFCVEGLD